MQSVLFLAALALGAAAQDLTINTPTVGTAAGAAECQPLLITYSGGTPPYIITVDTAPAGASHVVEFDNQGGTQLTWPAVNVTLNTQLLLTIKDTTGLTKNSAPFPVTAGSDSCLTSGGGAPPPSSGSSTGPAGTAPPATSGTSTGPGSASTPANSGASKSSSPSSSGSAKPSTTPGAAMGLHAPAGVVPAFAAIALAGLVALLA